MTTYFFKIFIADKYLISESYIPRDGLYSCLNFVTEKLKDTIILNERLNAKKGIEREKLPPVPELRVPNGVVCEYIRYYETEEFIYEIEVVQLIR